MAKRIFQGLILFFALYAFVFMPLGKKSALEHIRAILGTPAALEAASEVKGGVSRLVKRLESEARKSTEDSDRRLESLEDDGRGGDGRDGDELQGDERREAEAPRGVPKLRVRTLSSEKPASDRL